MKKPASQLLLVAELILVFVGIPSLLALRFRGIPPIPVLLVIATAGFLLLRADGLFERDRLFALPGENLRFLILRSIGLCVLLGVLVATLAPERLFDFPRRDPLLWILVLLLYPALSVYPQELLFRAFFFHRYRPLFRNDMSMVLASAAVFGFVHIIFGNWISVGLCAVGGVFFGITYLQTRSVLASSIEHAILGDFLFTIGLGEFFIHSASVG